MREFKQLIIKNIDLLIYSLVIVFILLNAILKGEYYVAVISAICGISYTFFAGKGYPFCYIIGLIGSGFYSFLSFKNALWGNLLLYACYYIPMQTIGYFAWNKNLKEGKKEIIKENLPLLKFIKYLSISIICTIILSFILIQLQDKHPILDSITTIFSILGMYFTVKRVIEQWIVWFIVNILSLIMWLYVFVNGGKVFSTVIMWSVYVIIAIYFYFSWRNEIKSTKTT